MTKLSKDEVGTLALEWCGASVFGVFAWSLMAALHMFFSMIPVVGELVWQGLTWLLLISGPVFALASIGAGCAAIWFRLVGQTSTRQALSGGLAVALTVAVGLLVWGSVVGFG